MKGPIQHIDVSLDGLHGLLHRIEKKALIDGDWAVLGALVLQTILKAQGRQERAAAKVAALSGPSTATIDAVVSTPAALPVDSPSAGTSDSTEEAKRPVKGHGRQGAAAFTKATQWVHTLAAGIIGALCAACGVGRMTRYRQKVIIRVVGQPSFACESHQFEQARCRACGQIIRADAPKEIMEGLGTSYTVYDWSACAMLAVLHYFAAMPLKRLESLHTSWGIPLPDANLWRILDEMDDLLQPLYKALERHGIQSAVTLVIDDTGSMVMSLKKQIELEILECQARGESSKDVRTGINATALILETPQGRIVLYFTGRHHAGEVLDRFLDGRKPAADEAPLIKVSDGASKNFNHQQKAKLLEAGCNAHAFMKFHDVKKSHPAEYQVAGETFKSIFDNDDKAKALGLSPHERMEFHQKHSKPHMETLRQLCAEKLAQKAVEPNSALWEPINFIINQWERLTQFYKVPGVPLDSNEVERSLIIPVRYLAASFNYKTETGAEVADRMMSLIMTCKANGVEPVAFLEYCLRHHEELAKAPGDFLPWRYKETLGAPAG